MKVYNISDVETPILREQGRVNMPIQLGGVVIPPGECREIHRKHRPAAMRFLGALALDRLPPGYDGKAKPQPTAKSPQAAPRPVAPKTKPSKPKKPEEKPKDS